MNTTQNERNLISPFFVFFLIYISIVDAGVYKFQKALTQFAGHDAWISVMATGIGIHLLSWMIYQTLSADDRPSDVFTINQKCFGNVVGKIIGFALILQFFLGAFITFRSYFEIIQVRLITLPSLLPLSLIIFLLIYYIVSGGFRAIVGFGFFGAISSLIILLSFNFFIIKYFHPQNLLPVMNRSVTDILLSSKEMSYHYLGIQALLIFYPFIKTPEKSHKWAQLGVFAATMVYVIILLTDLMYYSEPELKQTLWPTLQIIGMIELPISQRLEYFVISLIFIKIIAIISLKVWMVCRGAKHVIHLKPSMGLIAILIGFFILVCFVKDPIVIKHLTNYYSAIGFYSLYVYIPIIFLIMQVKKKMSAHRNT